jgi:hypothetical protein
MPSIYAGVVGLEVRVDTGLSLAGATLVRLMVRKPNGTQVNWTPTIAGTELVYVTQASDLTAAGDYRIMAYVEFGATSKHCGEAAALKILPAFG